MPVQRSRRAELEIRLPKGDSSRRDAVGHRATGRDGQGPKSDFEQHLEGRANAHEDAAHAGSRTGKDTAGRASRTATFRRARASPCALSSRPIRRALRQQTALTAPRPSTSRPPPRLNLPVRSCARLPTASCSRFVPSRSRAVTKSLPRPPPLSVRDLCWNSCPCSDCET